MRPKIAGPGARAGMSSHPALSVIPAPDLYNDLGLDNCPGPEVAYGPETIYDYEGPDEISDN